MFLGIDTRSIHYGAPMSLAQVSASTLDPTEKSTNTDDLPTLTLLSRALMLLGAEGASVGLAIGYSRMREVPLHYFTTNVVARELRQGILLTMIAAAAVFIAAGILYARRRRVDGSLPSVLLHFARRFAPLSVVGFVPFLYQWQFWTNHEIAFLILTAISLLCLGAALRTAVASGPFPWENSLIDDIVIAVGSVKNAWPTLVRHLPLVIVCTAALGYTVYFSYYTIAYHKGVYSSYDLAIENNVMWNVLHGNDFFKSTIVFGPVGSHFGYHATLFAYAMLPLYALAPRAETLLFIQSMLLGFAAVPLFLFARRHVSDALACILAVLYLLYPPVHGANMYEFHYPPLGTFFLWTLLYALDTRRNLLAAIALVLTLSIREDISAGPMIWGAYFLISGRRPKAGLIIASVSALYFVLIKLVVMPRFAGHETFAFIFKDLQPPGEVGFLSILKTVFSNPAFSIVKILEPSKLLFLLQVFVPLAFFPLRRPLGALFLVPGIFFSLLSTDYSPVVSIHYQYTAHWTTFLFVALILVLVRFGKAQRWASMGTIAFGLITCSYQYGSILQQNNSWGGPIPYKFGFTPEVQKRRAAMDQVLSLLPDDAKVSASVFVTPQISSRQFAYQLTIGVFDADYLVFPSERHELASGEQPLLTGLFNSGKFGLVAIHPPFAVAQRGHATDKNAEILSRW